MTFSPKTQRAIKSYGYDTCLDAFRMHDRDGEGGSTVGFYLGLKTNQADAAINAGREIVEAASLKVRYYTAENGHAEAKVDGLLILEGLKATDQGCYSEPISRRKADITAKFLRSVTPNQVLSFGFL